VESVPDLSVQPTLPPGRKGSKAGWVVAAIFALAAFAFASLWFTANAETSDVKSDLAAANSQLAGAKSDLDDVTAELADVKAERDALSTAADAAQAKADALPDVGGIVDDFLANRPGFDVTGDETYASISVTGDGLLSNARLVEMLVELGFPESIGARIGNTRALDGTLTADGNHVSATWTYHPDDGLQLVIERTA
jgi:hypothetical protein